MVTPNDISERTLSTAPQGYDIDETNAFLNEIAESYAAVYAENKELYRKLEVLAEKVEEYRDDEETIKEAVITAQKTAATLKKNAKEKSEKIMSDSAASAHRTVLNAKDKAEKLISEARDYATSLTREKAESANDIIEDAEKKANTALKSARVVAQDIIDKAKSTADEVISKASDKKDYYDQLTDKLREESSTFKNNMISLYETQLSKLREMMEDVDNATPDIIDINEKEMNDSVNKVFSSLDDIDASQYKTDLNDVIPDVPEGYGIEQDDIEERIAQFRAEADKIDIDEAEVHTVEPVNEPQEEEEVAEAPVEEIGEDAENEKYVDLNSAIDSFNSENYSAPHEVHVNTEKADEITLIDTPEVGETVANEEPVTTAKEEAPSDDTGKMPFENFFNLEEDSETDEKISLIAPEEEEEEEDLKFRGFFRKKKDKNK